MAYVRKRRAPKRTNRKRTMRKRAPYKKKLRPMYSNINYPLATAVVKRLKYVERIVINPSVGSISSYTFCANDLFDTNRSGIGHQPYGFDQLMALYNHYQVIGSKIRITPTAQIDEGYVYGLQLNDAITMSSADVETICEQPYAKRRIVAPGTNKATTMSQTFSLKKFFGANNNVNTLMGNRTFMGQVNTSPAEAAFFIVWCASNTYPVDPSPITFHVEIEYLAKFSEPRDLPQS